MIWVNGEVAEQIPLGDRSFQYGDGCFTTMLVKSGVIQLWSYHQQRLERCLDALQINQPDWQAVSVWLTQALSENKTVKLSGIKVHISRGTGGRGYSCAGFERPTVTISTFGYPDYYLSLKVNGISLSICERRMGLSPLLAGHKHNNRLEQVLLKSEVENKGAIDGIVLDINDSVIETTMANLFWFKNGELYTPKLDSAGVAGVMRRSVIEQAISMGTTVHESYYKLDDLLYSDEVFITNSLLTIAPVVAIEDRTFNIGTYTQKLAGRVSGV